MKKYKTERHSIVIHEVECVRETDKTIWTQYSPWGSKKIEERKHAKVSEYEQYHDTWDAAHAHLLGREERKLQYARDALQRAQSTYGNVKGMKRPETVEA